MEKILRNNVFLCADALIVLVLFVACSESNNGGPPVGAAGTSGDTGFIGAGVGGAGTGTFVPAGAGGEQPGTPTVVSGGVGGASGSSGESGGGAVGGESGGGAVGGESGGGAVGGESGGGAVGGESGGGGVIANNNKYPGYTPPCITKASQVVFIGDSYINMYPDTYIWPRVQALAQADGAIPDGGAYRNYAAMGASLGTGAIPDQFKSAKAADPDIKLVVMDGGGNDVILGASQCTVAGASQTAECQGIVQAAINNAISLFDTMQQSGVYDSVYFFYPHVVPNALGGMLAKGAPNEILDYSYPLASQNCDTAVTRYGGDKIRCYWIDTRADFGDTYQYINPIDGIHPTAAGADIIAGLIYDTMKANCLGMPASKGCCHP
jgi:lysophospholipase L1-like esterase